MDYTIIAYRTAYTVHMYGGGHSYICLEYPFRLDG